MTTQELLARIMPSPMLTGRLQKRHLPMLIAAYACLLPRELTVDIADAALFPYRLAILVLAPFAIANIVRSPVKPSFLDLLVVFSSAWYPVSFLMTTSVEAAMVAGLSYGLDVGLAYLIGRSAIRTAQDLRTIFYCFLPGILAVVVLLAAESLSHRMLLRPPLAEILGLPEPYIYFRVRYGLLRAMGPFPHPILSGVFMAIALPLVWYLSHNLKQRLIGCLVAVGAAFTVSATAVLGIFIAVGLIALDVIQRLTRLPVFLFGSLYFAAMIATISIFSEGGLVSFFIRRLTFDSGSGYYRLWIWEFGGAEALANPIFGIGQRDWTRPVGMLSDSVDSYWLLLAMYFGFPQLIAVLAIMLGTIFALLVTQRWRHPADRDVAKGIIFLLIIVIFAGLTVHLWEGVHSWIVLIIGAAVSLSTQARTAPQPIYVPATASQEDLQEMGLDGVRPGLGR